MDADDVGIRLLQQFLELIDFESRNAELGMNTRRFHVLVVTAARARVQPYKESPAAEYFRPGLQGIKIIQGDLQAFGERPFVFGSRREVGRI